MNDYNQEVLKLLIDALRNGEIGLNDYRNSLIARIPEQCDWAAYQNRIDPTELVWLSAKAGDSFALLRCKDIDINAADQAGRI